MQILLANPRGFCGGVVRAISIVKHALLIYGAPIYVYNEIVHNHYVVNNLRKQGVIFINKISEVPDTSVLIFSAHGVSKKIFQEAKSRNLNIVFDATCPLVTKVHMEVKRASMEGKEMILIGHAGHPEIEGTMGQYDNPNGGIYLIETIKDIWKLKIKNPNNLCFITQTTLSIYNTASIIKALFIRFPKIIGPYKSDICYATTNRQKITYVISKQADILIVIGSKNSSNSNRLVELAKDIGKPSYLINYADEIKEYWLNNVSIIGITAGASAPAVLVDQVIEYLKKNKNYKIIELNGNKENVVFKIPKNLQSILNKKISN